VLSTVTGWLLSPVPLGSPLARFQDVSAVLAFSCTSGRAFHPLTVWQVLLGLQKKPTTPTHNVKRKSEEKRRKATPC
jgi:hypothetical protein